MLALVASLVVSLAPALPVPVAACGEDSPTCDAPTTGDRGGERDYATPAIVACRSSAAPFDLGTFVGECEGTLYDASYRVSRSPESHEVTRALLPASRARRRAVSACDGLPPKGGDLTLPATQPLAVSETSRLVLTATRTPWPRAQLELPSRFGDPPDRPPRV